MAIDFSYLEGAAPQNENTATQTDAANVTIRVDADSLLLCDGDYIDHPFKAGVLTKIQLPIGQHLLEFLYTEDPDIKIEKEVDFPESGKSYLVIIKGLKDLVDAAAAEAKRKAAEEAIVKAAAEAKRKAAEEDKRIAALREPYVALSNNNQTLTFYFDHLKSNRNGMEFKDRKWDRRDIITVVFDESFANYHDLYSTYYWFYSYIKLTSVKGLKNLDTSKVTDMSNMFKGCESLKELDLSSFDNSKIADMSGMNVLTEDGEIFGTLKDVIETGANDVYVINSKKHGEVLIPAIKECILDVNVKEGKMLVHLMEGLIE